MENCAIIPAAGKGERFGIPKILMKDNKNFYFINKIISQLKYLNIKKIYLIIREQEKNWVQDNNIDAHIIINSFAESEMIDSIGLGIKKIEKDFSGGIMIYPVDYPYISNLTIKNILNCYEENSDCIIKPYFNNKAGHPVLLPNIFIKNFFKYEGITLNEKIHNSKIEIKCLNTSDEGILKNINYITDL